MIGAVFVGIPVLLILSVGYISYNGLMNAKSLSVTNPHLRDEKEAQRYRVKSLASSTAIETGESSSAIEKKIIRLRASRHRVTLA
jgi:hypothetical protein